MATKVEDRLANCDPDEIVSMPLIPRSDIPLWEAIWLALAQPVRELAEIYRDRDPSPLTLADIEELARRPEFRKRD